MATTVFFIFLLVGIYCLAELKKASGIVWGLVFLGVFNLSQHLVHLTELQGTVISALISILMLQVFQLTSHIWMPRNNIILSILENTEAYSAQLFIRSCNILYMTFKWLGLGPRITIDPSFGNPIVSQLKKHLKEQEWQQANHLLKNATIDEQRLTIEAVALTKGRPAFFDGWIQAEPENAVAYLLNGFHLLNWGWEVRGSGSVSTVTPTMHCKYIERLLLAEVMFRRVIELDDSSPEPYVGLVKVAMGLVYGKEALWENHIQMLKRDPDHYQGHSAMLLAMTRKWGGSSYAVFNFARNASNNAPPGSALHGLVAKAHLEEWVSLSMEEDSGEHDYYFEQEAVISDLRTSYEKCFPGDVVKQDPTSVELRNVYAFCCFKAGLFQKTAELLEGLDKNFTEYPWYYSDKPFLSVVDTAYAYAYACRQVGVKLSN